MVWYIKNLPSQSGNKIYKWLFPRHSVFIVLMQIITPTLMVLILSSVTAAVLRGTGRGDEPQWPRTAFFSSSSEAQGGTRIIVPIALLCDITGESFSESANGDKALQVNHLINLRGNLEELIVLAEEDLEVSQVQTFKPKVTVGQGIQKDTESNEN